MSRSYRRGYTPSYRGDKDCRTEYHRSVRRKIRTLLKEELKLKYPSINFVYGENGLNEVATYNIESGEYIVIKPVLEAFIVGVAG